jgi:transglutaminase-like putative cysteine protease
MKKLFLLFAFSFLGSQLQAGDPPKYEVSKIPAELIKGAKAVVRTDKVIVDVHDIGRATQKVIYAITIFNEEADSYTKRQVGYDKLTKINYIEGKVYDQFGKVVAKLKKSDIQDVATFDGFTFVSDDRVKVATLARGSYPYTVEFEYELDDRNLLHYTTWYTQPDPKIAVESATLEVSLPKDFPELRYYGQNLTAQVEVSERAGKKVYQWNWANVTVKPKREPYTPMSNDKTEILQVAPSIFEVEGYKGEMTSWENLGKWSSLLNQGREELPPATQAKIQEMTASIPNKLDKIKTLYEYMQSKTRYVGVQLGIGGWQPFPASEVDSKGYGDCKALSNYMKALLKTVGIESYYTLIRAGSEGEKYRFNPNFPSRQFNHVILCVPLEKDTLWLECTSQSQAAGYMGDFTDDRYALLVTPEGGKLVRTPTYQKKDNFSERKAIVKLDLEGNATAEIHTQYSGLKQDENGIDYYTTLSKDEQKKWLYEKTKIANFEITSFDLSRQKSRIPTVSENLKVKINALASKSGKRLFLQPNLLSKWEKIPQEIENRQEEVQVSSYDFYDKETIEFELPEGYYLEHKPEDVNIQSVFGEYQASINFEGNKIIYTRQVSLNKNVFPKEKYKEWLEFYKGVAKADKMKIVLVSKT